MVDLAKYFDLKKSITKSAVDLVESEIMFEFWSRHIDPDSKECKAKYKELHAAVKDHNLMIKEIKNGK